MGRRGALPKPNNHIAALSHAEGFCKQSEMVKFRAGQMLEWFEPRRMHEIRHLNPIDQEGVFFDRITHFISVFCAIGRLRP
jgi:hypothetical protein